MIAKRARGFTLIELMMVVTIIGVLASVAIPTLTKLTLRSKEAERRTVLITIKRGVEDLYITDGDIPGGLLVGNYTPPNNPPSNGPGPLKRVPNWTQAGWSAIFQQRSGTGTTGAPIIEGALYYSYLFIAMHAGSTDSLSLTAVGDLDGDGVQSVRWVQYNRSSGIYTTDDTLQYPVGWLDHNVDDGTF
ncbi:MAG TPA: prepilin-type N-terminal cleavage/methylation domain-containing protein [Anaeromyxobacter sp.]|nr:prepilin-type N-terminal cleavage/methylation domain-containing protein [Anaeromyxobacter sp.]